jgi:hypothetical protein
MITIRAHLDDCPNDNAPLLDVPGSHRLGRVAAERTADMAREHGYAPCLAGAGDLWMYATSILHASERAQSPRRRRVLQVDYAIRICRAGCSGSELREVRSLDGGARSVFSVIVHGDVEGAEDVRRAIDEFSAAF